MSRYVTYICGGDDRPGPRGTDCPDSLHDHPLPAGYVDASETAASRLYRQWRNVRCKQCGLYGWVPPAFGEESGSSTNPVVISERLDGPMTPETVPYLPSVDGETK